MYRQKIETMEKSKFNPFAPFEVEVYETTRSGKPRNYGVKDLTFKQAQEYFKRMTPDSSFQFFRIKEDGTREPVNMKGYQMQFAIWKRGFVNGAGDYQPGALMEICDSEAEANAKLGDYGDEHFVEPY